VRRFRHGLSSFHIANVACSYLNFDAAVRYRLDSPDGPPLSAVWAFSTFSSDRCRISMPPLPSLNEAARASMSPGLLAAVVLDSSVTFNHGSIRCSTVLFGIHQSCPLHMYGRQEFLSLRRRPFPWQGIDDNNGRNAKPIILRPISACRIPQHITMSVARRHFFRCNGRGLAIYGPASC